MVNNYKGLLCILLCIMMIVSSLSCDVPQAGGDLETSTQTETTPTVFDSYESIAPYLKARFSLDAELMKGHISPDADEFLSKFSAARSISVGKDDRYTCSVYQIKDKDGLQGSLLMILDTSVMRFSTEYYFFSHALSRSDLPDLKVGDNLEALYALDPSISFDLHMIGKHQINNIVVNDVIYKPLKDGILKLDVSVPCQPTYALSDYTIEEIAFCAYGDDVGNYVTVLPNFDADAITWLFAE